MPFVGTVNVDAARAFYGDKLGLKLVEDTPFALVFDVNGIHLRVTAVRELSLEPPRGSTGHSGSVLRTYQPIRQIEICFRGYSRI